MSQEFFGVNKFEHKLHLCKFYQVQTQNIVTLRLSRNCVFFATIFDGVWCHSAAECGIQYSDRKYCSNLAVFQSITPIPPLRFSRKCYFLFSSSTHYYYRKWFTMKRFNCTILFFVGVFSPFHSTNTKSMVASYLATQSLRVPFEFRTIFWPLELQRLPIYLVLIHFIAPFKGGAGKKTLVGLRFVTMTS